MNVAFATMRLQPFTNGHFKLISEMIRDNEVVIIGLGSVQIEKTANNPFSAKERTEMIRTVFGKGSKDKIKIIPLKDIGAVYKGEWINYCLNEIKNKQLPTPTRYYGGTENILWWENAVNLDNKKIEIFNAGREDSVVSGTFVRQLISGGSSEWKKYVPECLIGYIQEHFPKELTLEYHLEKK